MKLPDVNLLLYTYDSSSPYYPRSRTWLEGVLSGTESVGFAWSVLLGFLRISTHPRIFDAPLQPTEALDHIESWLSQPNALLLQPADRHGGEVCSADTDFSRFPGLRWTSPLS